MLQEKNRLLSRLGFYCFILVERSAKRECLSSVAKAKHFLCQEQTLKFKMWRLRLPRKRIKLGRQPCLCPKVRPCGWYWYISALEEVWDLYVKQHLPFCNACCKKPCVGILQSSQKDGEMSRTLTAPKPVCIIHITCSPSPVQIAAYLDLLQFFVLLSAKSNFSAKQVIKSSNYADVLRVGPSPVLLQFLIILSWKNFYDSWTHPQL